VDPEVVANIGAADPSAGAFAGPTSVRAAAMTGKTDDVRRFLEDERTHTVGQRLVDALAKGVNTVEPGVDFVVSTVGHTFDAIGETVEVAGTEMAAKVGLMRQRFHGAADSLRTAANEMTAWADSQVAERAQTAEAARAHQSAEVIAALADELDAVVELPSAGEMLVRGGGALFRVLAGGVDVFAELAHAGLGGVAAAISFVGKVAKKLVGSESLRSIGINVWGGIRLNLGSKKLNFGGTGTLWFPPLHADDAQDGKSTQGDPTKDYADSMFFDYGVSASTPAGGGGWSKSIGAGYGVNLFFLSASVSEKSESIFVGVPGLFGVTIGRDTLRGSYTAFGGGTPLLGGAKLGLYASHGFAVHTPLLDPVNDYVTRPAAKALTKVTEKVIGTFKQLWSGTKSFFGGAEPAAVETGGGEP